MDVMQHITRDDNDGGWRFTLALNATISTGGDGLYSTAKKAVLVTEVVMWMDDEVGGYELGVNYDTTTWDDDADGLIYTDEAFMAGLQAALAAAGCDADAVAGIDYSEQGMQNYGCVSCDAEELGEWLLEHIMENAEG